MTTSDERCARCWDDVSATSALYTERHVVQVHGKRIYLCGPCDTERRAARDRRRRGLSDEERRSLENAANVFGAFAPGGH